MQDDRPALSLNSGGLGETSALECPEDIIAELSEGKRGEGRGDGVTSHAVLVTTNDGDDVCTPPLLCLQGILCTSLVSLE